MILFNFGNLIITPKISLLLQLLSVGFGFGGLVLLSEQAQTQRAQYNKFGRDMSSRTGL